jgi:hypothetical protein
MKSARLLSRWSAVRVRLATRSAPLQGARGRGERNASPPRERRASTP